jgi:uncharacterized protein (UPF0276 family)
MPKPNRFPVQGAGLGLRRTHLRELNVRIPPQVAFMEIAPENWIDVGGRWGCQFKAIAERTPMVCHGLSLNLGGPAPLDQRFLQQTKQFLDTHDILCYSEHLSYCADDGHLYDLMPIPFTEEAVHHVARRIKRVQEIVERRVAIENVSYYCAPGQQMEEIDFVNAVLSEADCDLLLDINNIYVNSVNHGYDAEAYLKDLPADRIAYAHIAGHYHKTEDLIIDSHGANVINPVWQLLDTAYGHFGVFPTLLERDLNIPPLRDLLPQVDRIAETQQRYFGHLGDHQALGHG